MDEVGWWINGMLGLVTCAVLGVLTLVVDLVLTVVRGRPDEPGTCRVSVPIGRENNGPSRGGHR
jgi:hypothetical protein